MSKDMMWMATRYGWVFMGLEQPTDEEYQNLYDYMQTNDVTVDEFSLKGRWDPWWTAKIWLANETSTEKMGGLGSHTYETQKIGQGVQFMAEDKGPIWHINPDGERVYSNLDYDRTGRAYHIDDWQQSVAGPEPGSEAEQLLGEGEYAWDGVNRWWTIK